MTASHFLDGGGDMGERARAFDWSNTPLGPPDTWPQSRRTAVSLALTSTSPMFVALGPELNLFYNDSFAPLLGAKHPAAWGRPLKEAWSDIWPQIHPLVERTLAGEAISCENLMAPAERSGSPEQAWFTLALSPVRVESGAVEGVFCSGNETTERIRTEEALRKCQDLCRKLTNLIPMLVWFVDPDGKITFANEQWFTFTGITDEPAERWPDLVFHPDERDANVACWRRGLEERVPFEIEARIRRRGGEYRWYLTRAVPVRDEQGNVTGWFSASTDIHDRKVTEERLRESETYLRLALEAAQMGVWELSPDTAVLKADAVHQTLFGFSPQEEPRPARVCEERLQPDDQARGRERALSARKTSTAWRMEQRVTRPGGEIVWVRTQGRVRPGDSSRVIGTSFDVTERKRAEERLRNSEELFRQFAEHSANVLWIMNVEPLRLDYLSPAYERIWGEPRDAILADWTRWLETIHSDDREHALGILQRALEGEVVVGEYRIVRPEGAVRWIRDTFFPIRDDEGRMWRIGGVAQDLTRHSGARVYVVDADEASRQERVSLLQGAGYEVSAFASACAFLDVAAVLASGCVVLDTRQPEAGGLTVLRELKARRIGLPVIVAGQAHGDVRTTVQAMKAGAVDWIEMPTRSHELIAAVASALAERQQSAVREQTVDLARTRIADMPAREREVLHGLLAGGTNKTIARDLGISPRTVEVHRAHLMERLGARSVPELVQIAMAAGLQSRRPDAAQGL